MSVILPITLQWRNHYLQLTDEHEGIRDQNVLSNLQQHIDREDN